MVDHPSMPFNAAYTYLCKFVSVGLHNVLFATQPKFHQFTCKKLVGINPMCFPCFHNSLQRYEFGYPVIVVVVIVVVL